MSPTMKTKTDKRLDRRLACHGARGACFLDIGGDAPEAPDYTPIANANAEAARLAKEAADADIAFRRQVYEENKPAMEAARDIGIDAARASLGIMHKADERSDQQWDRYTNTFIPVEDQMVKEAMAYGGDADQETQAGRAVADVRTQAGISRANTARSLAAMGVNPNSGRFASGLRRVDIEEAGIAGSAANTARLTARDKGIALRAGAAGFGRNQVNTAGQMAGISTGAGSAGTGSANTGANAGLPMAQFAAGGTGNAINAEGMAINSNMGIAGLQRDVYNTQVASGNANAQALGAVAGALIPFGLKKWGQ